MVLRDCIKVGKYLCMQTRVSSEMEKQFRRKFRIPFEQFRFFGKFCIFCFAKISHFFAKKINAQFSTIFRTVFATFRESFYSLETLGKFLMKKLQRKVENLGLHVPGIERTISTRLLELKIVKHINYLFPPCLK